jgi:hypothetical protein
MREVKKERIWIKFQVTYQVDFHSWDFASIFESCLGLWSFA